MTDKHKSEQKTYSWGGNSSIPQIDVRGDGVAYIHASSHATDLPQLRKQFEDKNWATSSDIRNNDDNVLRVSGFTNIKEITDLLEAAKAVEGSPQITVNIDNHKNEATKRKSSLERLKNESLRAAGGLFVVGDLSYLAAGLARKDGMRGTGLFSLAGDLLLMNFGRHDDKREFTSLIKKLKKQYDEAGIDIPKDSALNIEISANSGSFIDKTYNFIQENVNPIKLICGIIAGSFTIRAGLTGNNNFKKAAGTCIVSGYLPALLIKEKKLDPEKYEKAGTLEKGWMKIQERPLRIAGYLSLANNGFFVASAYNDWKKGTQSINLKGTIGDTAGVSAMIAGNILYSISKKTTGGDIKSGAIIDDVYGLAAQILDRMPEGKRELAIKQTAEYLGSRVEIRDDKKTIETRMRNEIKALRSNPWFATEGQYTGRALTKNDMTLGA